MEVFERYKLFFKVLTIEFIEVIADIKIINNAEVLLLRCMKLNYEPNSDEYEFNYRDNKRVFWDDNCSSQFGRLLEFKYIKS